MINRVLIRIRIIQILFSVYQKEDVSLQKAESELLHCFQKSSDLYYYFLLLIIELTEAYSKRIDAGKTKLLPTDEDLNPNIKILENRFVKQLSKNTCLLEYLKERPMSWQEYETYVKQLLANILESKIYAGYISAEEDDYKNDVEFWRKIFKHIVCRDTDLDLLLEEQCIYWNDDVEIIQSFVLKTIKRFEETNGENQPLLPMFRDEEDRQFAIKLLRESMLNVKSYRDMINEYAQNWESERIAFMDMIIMQVAIAEIMHFPSIPVNVTLNEYIDIGKAYSSDKSSSFINGILDPVVQKLREEKKIIK